MALSQVLPRCPCQQCEGKLRLRSCVHALCMHAGHATVRQDCAALRVGCGRWSGPGGPGFLLGVGFA